MFLKRSQRNSGYSLVELMVTIGIIGMLTVIMIPAVRSFDKRNRVTAASEQFKSAILEIRNFSMSPRFTDYNIARYAIKIDDLTPGNQINYELGYYNKSDVWTMISQRSLPKGVSISAAPIDGTGVEIAFDVPDAMPRFEGDLNYTNRSDWGTDGIAKYTLSSSGTNDTLVVTIDSYMGLVNIDKEVRNDD